MKFDEELKKGNFFISECSKCKKIVWPPLEICNVCLTDVTWRKSSKEGEILEYSKYKNEFFGVIKIENSLKLIGKIVSGVPEIGKKIRIIETKTEDGNYVFNMKVLD